MRKKPGASPVFFVLEISSAHLLALL